MATNTASNNLLKSLSIEPKYTDVGSIWFGFTERTAMISMQSDVLVCGLKTSRDNLFDLPLVPEQKLCVEIGQTFCHFQNYNEISTNPATLQGDQV